MKPDWDKLGKKYYEHPSVLIVDVDCTAEGQGTCNKVGVKGYPTIKYYMAGDKKGKDYQGGRDLNSLTAFVEKTLNKAVCDVVTKEGCAANEKAYIEKLEDKSVAELQEELATKTKELKEVKSERSKEQADHKAKDKAFQKKEKLLAKAQNLVKQLEKIAQKKAKSEL